MLISELSLLLNYKNQRILNRYEQAYPNNKLTNQEAFAELMKFFWLSEKHQHDLQVNFNNMNLKFTCAIHPEMAEIDDMWHTFLLFTQDYANFCHHFFGHFIHHCPTDENDKLPLEQFKIELERYLAYIFDHLGEETLKLWFQVS